MLNDMEQVTRIALPASSAMQFGLQILAAGLVAAGDRTTSEWVTDSLQGIIETLDHRN